MRILLILLFSTTLNVALTAKLKAAEVKSKDGYSFTAPQGWTAIPQDIVAQALANMKKTNPAAKSLNYSYVFQLSESKNWFEYPFFVVQISRIGRYPEKYLKNLTRIEKDIQKGVDKAEKSFKGTVKGKINNTVYDKKYGIIWNRLNAEVDGEGKVNGLSGMKLTSYGSVIFVLYAREKDFSKYEKDFRRMIWKMNVDKEYQY